jgi:hypothetical protein
MRDSRFGRLRPPASTEVTDIKTNVEDSRPEPSKPVTLPEVPQGHQLDEIEVPLKKRIRPAIPSVTHEEWRTLDDAVEVELTSEDPDWPIEHALQGQGTSGWRATAPGPQTIRLAWPAAISIRRIRLLFDEHSHARTQEFVLRATTAVGEREIVRQQFTFSPPGTTIQCEEYATNLDGVSQLELAIIPAIDGGSAIATLREWRIE